MVNMSRLQRFGGDMNRAHAKRMRHRKIARIVFKHRGSAWVQTVLRKDAGKGCGLGFGQKIGILDAVNRVKQPVEPPRFKHAVGIGHAGVGIDNLAAGQGADLGGKAGIARKQRKINVMHIAQIGRGIDVMFAHQPGQRGAVAVPIVLAQPISFGLADAKCLHHPSGHSHLDLVEKPKFRRIKRVIQIKDPSRNM